MLRVPATTIPSIPFDVPPTFRPRPLRGCWCRSRFPSSDVAHSIGRFDARVCWMYSLAQAHCFCFISFPTGHGGRLHINVLNGSLRWCALIAKTGMRRPSEQLQALSVLGASWNSESLANYFCPIQHLSATCLMRLQQLFSGVQGQPKNNPWSVVRNCGRTDRAVGHGSRQTIRHRPPPLPLLRSGRRVVVRSVA